MVGVWAQVADQLRDVAGLARQLRQLGVTAPWVGSPSITNVTALKLAGPSLYGTYGVADYAEESSDAARAYGKAYRAATKIAPDNQSSWTFDAVTVLALAINKAGKADPQAIREALLAVRGHAGAEGTYNFESGEVVLWQPPNRLALLSTAGAALTVVAPAGSPLRRATVATTAVVATWWGADELARGVNPFRRAVGGALGLVIAGAGAFLLRGRGGHHRRPSRGRA